MNTHECCPRVPACLLLALSVLIITWPLALHLTDGLPLGTEQESTVPLFNIWTLWWVADRAAHGFEGFWQAPIFYPSEGAFTFSEPQPLTGLLALPFWQLSHSPVAAYNAAVLLCLFLNGLCAYRVGLALQIPRHCSLIGGMLMIGLPVTAKLLGVLPLLPLFGLLLALEGFVRFGRDGSWTTAMLSGAGLLAQLFASQQLALLFGLFALPAGLLALSLQGFRLMPVVRLGIVALSVTLVTAWYAWYPVHLHHALNFTRSDSLVRALSAHPMDYFSKPLTALIAFPPREDIHTDTGGLFPGFGLLFLAGWGMLNGLRQPELRAWTWYFSGTGSVAFILSLGSNSPFDGGGLFTFLRDWVPGLHELRSPFRFAILLQLSLVLLSLNGLARLGRMRLPMTNVMALCLAGSLAAAENLSVPQPLAAPSFSLNAPWMTWLARQEERKIIGHVPFPQGLHVSDYQIETERMLAQITHHKPLINGYSGYFPPGYSRFQLDMASAFPSDFLLCFLGQVLNVDTLIIDRNWFHARQNQVARHEELSRVAYQDDTVVILELLHTGGDCRREQGLTPTR